MLMKSWGLGQLMLDVFLISVAWLKTAVSLIWVTMGRLTLGQINVLALIPLTSVWIVV